MYKRVKTKKLGRTVSHRNALVQNMVRSMVVSGSVKTTTPKAKVLKGEMESILTKIENTKDGDLSLRRDLQVMLGNSDLVKKLLGIKGAKVVIKKVGFRSGDNSEVSVVEVDRLKEKKARAISKKKEGKDEERKEIEMEVNEPKVVDKSKKRNILDLGKKSVKEAAPVKRERAKSRSGL